MISNYKLKARVYPAVISLLPLLILGIYFSIDLESWYGLIGGISLLALLQFILSEIGRDRGKKIEPKLWKHWGGTPTTQILRFSNDRISESDKMVLHKKLHKLTNTGKAKMLNIEAESLDNADEIYSSWSNYLRRHTRDTKKFNLLFQENVSYGFRRNLLGLKMFSIILIFVVIGIITGFEFFEHDFQFSELSKSEILILFSLLGLFIFWVAIVTRSWVKAIAFSYAERLIETTDFLED